MNALQGCKLSAEAEHAWDIKLFASNFLFSRNNFTSTNRRLQLSE
jgi:hypothetical protein